VFDQKTVFIGSFNLDPRSANLNTELGVVFESTDLAVAMVERLEKRLGQIAWHVELVPGQITVRAWSGCPMPDGKRWNRAVVSGDVLRSPWLAGRRWKDNSDANAVSYLSLACDLA
jgi:phosphatidylserine/phosphatidylglycerophosphate/cardiolipin synthase-like enzyme